MNFKRKEKVVDLAVLSYWLDSRIIEVFSKLNGSTIYSSEILPCSSSRSIHTGAHTVFLVWRGSPPEGSSSSLRCGPELLEKTLVGDILVVQVSQRDHVLEGRDMSL